MPRLLLVDDNPSIHKIAETLLATTPIELVCVDSAAAALERVHRGEHFDVALVDTSMAGMDGWGLLEKLRQTPSTARMPIAMMAGVLDTVDPERIQAAPIQGFLKKPVELRELGDRIARLLETPVPEPPKPEPMVVESAPEPPLPPVPVAVSPFATMPAVRIDELPEYRRKEEPESLEDLLELTEEDLYPEAEPEILPVVEESLDLEELDLDSLRNLQELPVEPLAVAESEPTPAPFPPLEEHAQPTPQSVPLPAEELDAIATLDKLPVSLPSTPEVELAPLAEMDPAPVAEMELPDLGPAHDDLLEVSTLSGLPEIEELVTAEQVPATEIPLAALLEPPKEEAVFTPPLPPLEESLDWSDESESMLAAVEAPAPLTVDLSESPKDEIDLLDVAELDAGLEPQTLQLESIEAPEPVVEAVPLASEAAPLSTEAIVESALLESVTEEPVVETVAPPIALPLPSGTSKDLLDAMMADPAMMDALAKAVVARLGDQVLREIAWEVIPEVAERIPRN